MRVGVIAACEDELNPFLEFLNEEKTETRAMLRFHIGTYAGVDVVAVFCGVCKVNAAVAAQILIDMYDVTSMIMIGVAGAIDRELNIADTVISEDIAYHDVAKGILTDYHPWMKSEYFRADEAMLLDMKKLAEGDKTVFFGRIVTGEAFITSEGRDEIIERHAPLCVDMETGAVAHVCYVNAVPFIAIRSISDTPGECGAEAFEKYAERASAKAASVLIGYLDILKNKS